MTHLVVGLVALALTGVPATDPDPRPLHVELRGGIGTGEFHGSASGENRSAGANWSVRMGFRPLLQLVVSLGYGQSSFGCQGGLCAQSPVTFSGGGVEVGAAADWRAVQLGAGVTRQTLRGAWIDPERVQRTSKAAPSFGWFADLSVDIPVSAGFSVSPGVRYLRHGADFGTGGSRATVQMMADVGVRYRLPFESPFGR